MSCLRAMPVQYVRLTIAIAIVAALVFGPMALDAALGFQKADAQASQGIDAMSAVDGKDPQSQIDEVDEMLASTLSKAPDWFDQEVGLPPNARDVRVSSDGNIVGYSIDADLAAHLESVEESLVGKGWRSVPLGDVTGATYVREGKTPSLVMVTASQVDEATCVIVRRLT